MKLLEDKGRFLCDICRLSNRSDCKFDSYIGGHCKLCGGKDTLPMQGEKRYWYHVACMALNAFLVPESRVKFGTKFISIEQPQKSTENQHEPLPCSICSKSEGLIYNCTMMAPKEFESQSTIECSGTSKCNIRFHPICAYFVELLLTTGRSTV